jgi:MYXO-CTERM domain-containing protein
VLAPDPAWRAATAVLPRATPAPAPPTWPLAALALLLLAAAAALAPRRETVRR